MPNFAAVLKVFDRSRMLTSVSGTHQGVLVFHSTGSLIRFEISLIARLNSL